MHFAHKVCGGGGLHMADQISSWNIIYVADRNCVPLREQAVELAVVSVS